MSLAAVLCAAALAGPLPAPPPVPIPSSACSETAPPDDPSSLSLEQAILRARERWPALAAARERARVRAASEGAAARWLNPSLEISRENWRPGGRAPDHPALDSFVLLTQPVEIAGQRGARRRVAAAESQLAAIASAGSERDLVVAVSQTFLEAVRARDVLRVLEAQRDGIAEMVALLERRVAEGVAAEADLRKVEADLGRAAIEATRAGADLFEALARLGVFLGEDPPPAAASLLLPPPAAPPGGLDVEAAIARRADVQAARARVAAAAAADDLERRRRWPDLLVTAGYKRTAGIDTGVVGVAVPVPLFDRNDRARALAAGEQRAAELEARQVESAARAELASARVRAEAMDALAGRLEHELLLPAEVARRAARTSFREGAGDVLRYLDAERVHADAAREAIAVRVEAALAAVRVRVAAGEVWP